MVLDSVLGRRATLAPGARDDQQGKYTRWKSEKLPIMQRRWDQGNAEVWQQHFVGPRTGRYRYLGLCLYQCEAGQEGCVVPVVPVLRVDKDERQ